ncbi:hypothetical protein E2C01_049229 [Portunus trituberculatus]|uniref:Uncharacterized protein n=1 Tax=Portunus trituberculatus TaxID=210409 RepID=A0A5B7GDB4_PORTR|nr:hypothetical protein [Portunus trituberculatus]
MPVPVQRRELAKKNEVSVLKPPFTLVRPLMRGGVGSVGSEGQLIGEWAPFYRRRAQGLGSDWGVQAEATSLYHPWTAPDASVCVLIGASRYFGCDLRMMPRVMMHFTVHSRPLIAAYLLDRDVPRCHDAMRTQTRLIPRDKADIYVTLL